MLGQLSVFANSSPFDSDKEEAQDRPTKQKNIIEKTEEIFGIENLEKTLFNRDPISIEKQTQQIYEYQTKLKHIIRIPSTFNGYDFIHFINKGSFSVVALVRFQKTGKFYAAKIISMKDMSKLNELQSIQNEIMLLRSMNHKNVMKYIDSFTIEDDNNNRFFVIITEYYEGGNLAQLIESNGVNVENIQNIFSGIAKAVRYIHTRGIAHLDIKPDNILLDKDFNPVLCDFGFAVKGKITSSTRCTPQYAAPEILKQSGTYNPICADIWALGVTFFATLTKNFPYSYKELSYMAIEKALARIRDDSLKKLMRSCFIFDSEKRATIKDIVKCDFFMKKKIV